MKTTRTIKTLLVLTLMAIVIVFSAISASAMTPEEVNSMLNISTTLNVVLAISIVAMAVVALCIFLKIYLKNKHGEK